MRCQTGSVPRSLYQPHQASFVFNLRHIRSLPTLPTLLVAFKASRKACLCLWDLLFGVKTHVPRFCAAQSTCNFSFGNSEEQRAKLALRPFLSNPSSNPYMPCLHVVARNHTLGPGKSGLVHTYRKMEGRETVLWSAGRAQVPAQGGSKDCTWLPGCRLGSLFTKYLDMGATESSTLCALGVPTTCRVIINDLSHPEIFDISGHKAQPTGIHSVRCDQDLAPAVAQSDMFLNTASRTNLILEAEYPCTSPPSPHSLSTWFSLFL